MRLGHQVWRLLPQFVGAVAAAVALSSAAQTTYRVIDIGALPGDAQSVPHDINDAGEVAGISGGNRLFLWSAKDGIRDAGVQVEAPYFFWRQPQTLLRMNNRGTVVGPNFVRRSNGVVTYRENVCLPACYASIEFGGVNDNDEVAVTSMTPGSYTALIYNARTGKYRLDDFFYPRPAHPYAINGNGVVVGGMWPAAARPNPEAFFANPSPIQITQGYGGESYDINKSNQTVGEIGGLPFRYQTESGISTVSASGAAYGINDQGHVVGAANGRAFIWNDTGAYYLDALIDASDPNYGNLTLARAAAINNVGDVVAETSAGRAVLLTPVIEIVDPVPNLLDGTKVSDTERLVSEGRLVQGLAADGVAMVLLRIPSGAAEGEMEISIQEDGNADDSTSSCRSSLGITTDVCGALGRLGEVPSETGIKVPIRQTSRGAVAFALYRAPLDFSWGSNSQQGTLPSRNVYIKIRSESIAGGEQIREVPIKIIRPMAIFLHGLWASSDDLGVLDAKASEIAETRRIDYGYPVVITDSKPKDRLREQLRAFFAKEYPSSLLPAYGIGSALGLKFSTPRVRDRIGWALEEFREGKNKLSIRVASGAVDIVGHSMGALVARNLTYYEGDENSKIRAVLRGSFGLGYVHKIISVGGPHLGSPIASALESEANGCWLEHGIIPYDVFHECDDCVAANDLAGGYLGSGAIGDLQGSGDGSHLSKFLTKLRKSPPSKRAGIAYVAGTVPSAAYQAFDRGTLVQLLSSSLCINAPITRHFSSSESLRAFLGGESDGIVPLPSQVNGVSLSDAYVIKNSFHSPWAKLLFRLIAAPEGQLELSEEFGNMVLKLLNTPVKDDEVYKR